MARFGQRARCALAVAAATALLAAAAAAQTATIGISPLRIEMALGERPAAEAIQIMNLGAAPIELAVSVSNWILDETNQVRVIEPTEQSLDQWIVISPLRFTVPPGKQQTVRFTVRPKVRPEPGEHRAMIFFDEVPEVEAQPGQTRVVGRIGVAVYAHVGDVTRRAVLDCIDVVSAGSTVAALFDISSTGTANARMAGRYVIWPADRFKGLAASPPDFVPDGKGPPPEGAAEAAALPSTPVLPGFRRRIVMRLSQKLAPGAWVLEIDGRLGEDPLRLAFPFEVVPEPRAQAR